MGGPPLITTSLDPRPAARTRKVGWSLVLVAVGSGLLVPVADAPPRLLFASAMAAALGGLLAFAKPASPGLSTRVELTAGSISWTGGTGHTSRWSWDELVGAEWIEHVFEPDPSNGAGHVEGRTLRASFCDGASFDIHLDWHGAAEVAEALRGGAYDPAARRQPSAAVDRVEVRRP